MFGIGGPELIVIIVLALILVGPDQLPKVVKTVGTGVRDLRRMANMAQAELRETVDDLVREIETEPEEPSPAEKARSEAQRRAAAAVAAARARGADGPPAPIEPTAAATAGADGDGASAQAEATLETANAAPKGVEPATPPKAAAAVPTSLAEARALAEERASKRREIGQLLAEEAAKLQASRAKALADANHLDAAGLRAGAPDAPLAPAPAPAPTVAPSTTAAAFTEAPVEGAVPRGAPPARPGSLAAAMQRGGPSTSTPTPAATHSDAPDGADGDDA